MRTVLKELIKVLDGIPDLQHFFYSEFYEEGQKKIDFIFERHRENKFSTAWKLVREFLDDVVDEFENDGIVDISFSTDWIWEYGDEKIEEGFFGYLKILSDNPSYHHYPQTTATIKLLKVRSKYCGDFYRACFSVDNYKKFIGYNRSRIFNSFEEAYNFLSQAIRDFSFEQRVFFGKKEAIDWTTLIDGQ